MMINTDYLTRCVIALERGFFLLEGTKAGVDYDIYRSAVIKEFEISLEQSGKLLKYLLKSYFAKSNEVNKLTFKEIFKYGAKFDLLTENEVQRWCQYRDSRNDTAHEYGQYLAEEVLPLIPKFIIDAKKIIEIVKNNEFKE
jgi:nucleotidyltransferase substrate binding protein (TIGR01987 family)